MTRRSRPYLIELPADPAFKLSGAEWHDAVDRGLASPVPERIKTARPTSGVIARVWDRDLYLFDRIRVSSAGWFRLWLYRVATVRAADILGNWEDRQERAIRDLDREIQNEALLWRTFRDKRTKGANSFAWIDVETKREVIGALRPEIKSPPDDGGLLVCDDCPAG